MRLKTLYWRRGDNYRSKAGLSLQRWLASGLLISCWIACSSQALAQQRGGPTALAAGVRIGVEHDDNAHRVEAADAKRDFLTRYFATLDATHEISPQAQAFAGMRLGAKVFFEEHSADSLLTQIDLGYQQRISNRVTFSGGLDIKDLTERLSLRDYTRGGARLGAGLSLGIVRLSASAGWRYFAFKPQAVQSSHGPNLSLGARAQLTESIGLELGYTMARRLLDSQALRLEGNVFILDSSGELRRDSFHGWRLGASYRSFLLLDASYGLSINTSNSYGQQLLRHSIDLMVTTPLFWEVYMSLRGELQRTSYTDPVLVDEFFVTDEENRNAAILAVARPFAENWEIEARFSLYLQEFGVGSQYSRQTFLIAIGYGFE
ncbi:MAG: hypothetical protein H0U74_15020 [Bradymonadaceae bacterium]|nr:hypothetical protein [Lujinxingiaceae bacterium]